VAKKQGPKRPAGGWPKRSTGQDDDPKLAILRRMERLLDQQQTDPARLNALTERLTRLLLLHPRLRTVRPRQDTVREVLGSLDDDDREALTGGKASPHRARRVRQRVFPALFDGELLRRLLAGLYQTVRETSREADLEALAVGISLVQRITQGAMRPADSPMVGMLMAIIGLEAQDMDAALEALYALAETGGEDGKPSSKESFQEQLSELMRAHPTYVPPVEMHMHEQSRTLMEVLAHGTVEACLPREAVEPYVPELLRRGMPDASEEDVATAIAAVPEGGLRGFAADAANQPLYDEFHAAFAAEVEAAQKEQKPDADGLAEAFRFWSVFRGLFDSTRLVVATAGVVRAALAAAKEEDAKGEEDRPRMKTEGRPRKDTKDTKEERMADG